MASSPIHSPVRPTGRPPVKQRAIVDMLHRQIVEGFLLPGSQLPTRRDLVAQFGGSFLSVQQALDQLVSERFVEARGPAGTFVSQHPPHLHDYALIVSQKPGMPGYRRFWDALCHEARRISESPGSTRNITCWYGIDGHADSEDFQTLSTLVRRRRLAGIIFGAAPFLLGGTSLLDFPGIPRVAMARETDSFNNTSIIDLNTESFVVRAVNHLASLGRKRIAMICVPGLSSRCLDAFARELQSNRMMTRPYWTLKIEPSIGPSIREIAHLLMNRDQKSRPDALIIADDNLVEPVTAGLVDAGVSTPKNLDIVAHCNFPWNTPSHVPVCRLGFDAREVLGACFGVLDDQRENHHFGSPVSIKARFETEIHSLPIDSQTTDSQKALT